MDANCKLVFISINNCYDIWGTSNFDEFMQKRGFINETNYYINLNFLTRFTWAHVNCTFVHLFFM